jgi:hypothetical protein
VIFFNCGSQSSGLRQERGDETNVALDLNPLTFAVMEAARVRARKRGHLA